MSSYAKIVADSLSDGQNGVRLTTFEVRFRRSVLAEFNTHCVLSRNSESSRAVPVMRKIERIMREPAYPVAWVAEQKGMSGGAGLPTDTAIECMNEWHEAAMDAVYHAQALVGKGAHKSIINRLLEPFMWHTAVVTATAWENFFLQRCDMAADPAIREVALLMEEAYRNSKPVNTFAGDWHIPYTEDQETTDFLEDILGITGASPMYWPTLAKISAARCAGVSYFPPGEKAINVEADLKRYDKLMGGEIKHWSPLEHVATPWRLNRQDTSVYFRDEENHGKPVKVETSHLPRVGKLLGWRSLRTTEEAKRKEITFR